MQMCVHALQHPVFVPFQVSALRDHYTTAIMEQEQLQSARQSEAQAAQQRQQFTAKVTDAQQSLQLLTARVAELQGECDAHGSAALAKWQLQHKQFQSAMREVVTLLEPVVKASHAWQKLSALHGALPRLWHRIVCSCNPPGGGGGGDSTGPRTPTTPARPPQGPPANS